MGTSYGQVNKQRDEYRILVFLAGLAERSKLHPDCTLFSLKNGAYTVLLK